MTAGEPSPLQLSQEDVDLLRSSMMDLSRALPVAEQPSHQTMRLQQPAVNGSEDPAVLLRMSSHPVDAAADASSSSGASSDIPEELPSQAQQRAAPLQHHQLAAVDSQRQRVSRPLSSSRPASLQPGDVTSWLRRAKSGVEHHVYVPPPPAHLRNAKVQSEQQTSGVQDAQPPLAGSKVTHGLCEPSQAQQSAVEVVENLGNGSGIMSQLRSRVAQLDGQQARAMQSVLQTLGEAEAQGTDLSSIFANIMSGGDAASSSEEGKAQSAGQGRFLRQGKGPLRLPRGLESKRAEARQSPRGQQNEWRLRLLAGYDDSQVVGLAGIAMFNQNQQQCVPAYDTLCLSTVSCCSITSDHLVDVTTLKWRCAAHALDPSMQIFGY
jgi:hypothetical protein